MLKRFLTGPLLFLSVLFLFPSAAFAAGDTVSIESEYNDAFDYLEYYSDGSWHDLNTPRHWITSTGEVCYCVQHSYDNPHGARYNACSPDSVFSSDILLGLQAIFENGYPCITPAGFSPDEARQATANAIRFFLSERGESGSYSFTNRRAYPDAIRAKSGYAHVLNFADELLALARSGSVLEHSITFEPESVSLKRSGDVYTGRCDIHLSHINSGYTLSLPDGCSVSGYTGSDSERLTFSVPRSRSGETLTVTASGKDTRTIENITAYLPSNSSFQNVFLCASTARVVATADLSVKAPSQGDLKIAATADSRPLAGCSFSVYSDAEMTDLLYEGKSDENGCLYAGDLPAGPVYVRQDHVPAPYLLDTDAQSGIIPTDGTKEFFFENVPAQGVIEISVQSITADFENGEAVSADIPVENAGVTVLDQNGSRVFTGTTDSDGKLSSEILPLGTYTVQIRKESWPMQSSTVHLEYLDELIPLVYTKADFNYKPTLYNFKLLKLRERIENGEVSEEPLPGAVFGIYREKYNPDKCILEVVTDGNGIVETGNVLPAGYYVFRELSIPSDDLLLDETPYRFLLGSEKTDFTEYYDHPLLNRQKSGRIRIKKLDFADETPLFNAAYTITGEGFSKEYFTDINGEIISERLKSGIYTVTETRSPEGYVLDATPKTVQITNGDVDITFRDEDLSITLYRNDALFPNRHVEGAKVAVTCDGRPYAEAVTGKYGTIYLETIPDGSYCFYEVTPADRYRLNPQIGSFQINPSVRSHTAITAYDSPTEVHLFLRDALTMLPIGNVPVQIQNEKGECIRTKLDNGYRCVSDDPDAEDSFLLDAEGCAAVYYFKKGTYTVLLPGLSGYVEAESRSFTVSDDVVSKELLLRPTGLKILKTDADSGKALPGVGFEIRVRKGLSFEDLDFEKLGEGIYRYSANGKETDLYTDANGTLLLYGIPKGEVYAYESVPPEGYFPVAAARAELGDTDDFENPLLLNIKNSVYVKLGKDSDWWEFPTVIACLMLGIAVPLIVFRSRRHPEKYPKT